MQEKSRVLIIGVDGATFDVIRPMLSAGRLPNIASLMKEGSYGELASTVPCLSPTAWTSFMTGTGPARHGIIDFFARNAADYGAVFFNASYRKLETIWSMAGRAGKKVVVLNVPMTYPPEKVNGVMVSGMDTPDASSNFMHPEELKGELDRAVGGYKLERGGIRNVMGKSDPEEVFEILENRFEVTKHLLMNRQWDLFMMMFEATDRVQHNFWETVKTGKESSKTNLVARVYEEIDAKIGELARLAGDDTTLVVMSDHGFGPIDKAVRLNHWLAEKGYLKPDANFRPSNSAISNAKASIMRKVKRFMPESFKAGKGGDSGPRRGHQMLPGVDWDGTRAYAFGGMGNIFINLKGREAKGVVSPGAEYEALRDELVRELKGLKDPETGAKILLSVRKREELYPAAVENAPDILIEWAYGYSFIGENERLVLKIDTSRDRGFFSMHRWKGNHMPNGILIMRGPAIARSKQLSGAGIVDVAPTILYQMGLPVPGYMDGRVLVEAVAPDFLKANAVTYEGGAPVAQARATVVEYTDDEEDAIKSKLKGLGYIE